MKAFTILILLSCLASLCFAATLSVALDGSQAYTSIQSAIDASVHGDVVLVYPGRYIENLRFYGKNITLASLEYTTGDNSYQYVTIIDGNRNGAVIQIGDSESNVQIRGFTLTRGIGLYTPLQDVYFGGAINVQNMSGQKNLSILNCTVTDNQADYGGGLWISACNTTISGVSIFRNTGSIGGGLYFIGSDIMNDPEIFNFDFSFDFLNRCSIYNNYAASGSDIHFQFVNDVHVVLDTFTVATPTNFYASAASIENISNPYTFDILNHIHTEINQDFFVAPWGDDSNSGLCPDEPMKSIFMAMYKVASDSLNPKTVHVAPGTYSSSLNHQIFPIPLKNHTRIQGESSSLCILNAEDKTALVSIPMHSRDFQIRGLSLINGRTGILANKSEDILIEDVIIDNISEFSLAQGIEICNSSDITISNVKISNVFSNQSATGIGLTYVNGNIELLDVSINDCSSGNRIPTLYLTPLDYSRVVMDGCKFYNNSNNGFLFPYTNLYIKPPNYVSQGVRIDIRNSSFYNNFQNANHFMGYVNSHNDSLIISNCTFADNSGGSAVIALTGNINLRNNLFWNQSVPTEVLISYYRDSNTPSTSRFEYNNIRGGISGISNQFNGNPMYWASTNLNLDPLFSGIGNHPFTLSAASPLIDMGMPNHEHLNLGDYDAGGNARLIDGDDDGISRIDIGAYEYQNMPAPYDLSAIVMDSAIYLQWQMPTQRKRYPGRELRGYRIFRNGMAIVDIGDLQQWQYLDQISQSDTLRYVVVALYGYVESAASNEVVVYIEVMNSDVHSVAEMVQLRINPNPFVHSCNIEIKLQKDAPVAMEVYNLRGQKVKSLVSKEHLSKGGYNISWDSTDSDGKHLAAGIYFLRLDYGAQKPLVKRVVMMK